MSTTKQIITLLKNHHKNGEVLSKIEVISILESIKAVTKNKKIINSLIFFFTTLEKDSSQRLSALTRREHQVLYYIGTGNKSLEIATTLQLSISTVETHRKNIRKKLNLIGKGKLIEYAILNNLQQLVNPPVNDDIF